MLVCIFLCGWNACFFFFNAWLLFLVSFQNFQVVANEDLGMCEACYDTLSF